MEKDTEEEEEEGGEEKRKLQAVQPMRMEEKCVDLRTGANLGG